MKYKWSGEGRGKGGKDEVERRGRKGIEMEEGVVQVEGRVVEVEGRDRQ